MVTHRVFVNVLLGVVLLAVVINSDDACQCLSQVKTLGTGQVSVDADVAIIYAYIMQDGTTVAEAINKAEAVLSAIETVLIQNKLPKSSIETSYLSVYPKYDFTTGTGVANGYTVYISLTITIKPIGKNNNIVGTLIQGLTNAGVSSVSGITYDVQDKQKYASQARKAAYLNALKKAKQYAEIVDGKLGRILKIDESGLSYYPYFTSNMLGNSTGYKLGQGLNNFVGSQNGSTDSNFNLPLGKVSIVVDVIVTWVLNTLCV